MRTKLYIHYPSKAKEVRNALKRIGCIKISNTVCSIELPKEHSLDTKMEKQFIGVLDELCKKFPAWYYEQENTTVTFKERGVVEAGR